MNPFEKKVRTQTEKDELLRQARAEWDRLGELQMQDMVARSEAEFLGKLSDSIIVEKEPFVAPRELTAAEKAAMDGRLMFSQIYGDRADSSDTGIPALDDLAKANQEEAFRKLLGPAQRAESALEGLIRSVVVKVVENPSSARRHRNVLSLEERLLAWAGESRSDVVRFLRARVAGDLTTQRQIARALAAG